VCKPAKCDWFFVFGLLLLSQRRWQHEETMEGFNRSMFTLMDAVDGPF